MKEGVGIKICVTIPLNHKVEKLSGQPYRQLDGGTMCRSLQDSWILRIVKNIYCNLLDLRESRIKAVTTL